MDLKSFRLSRKWTQQDAAQFAGFSNATVWRRYETGERYPEPAALERIEKLTGGEVTASDMLRTRRAWEREQEARAARSNSDQERKVSNG